MDLCGKKNKPDRVVVFTPYPPDHALCVLRISGPLTLAGIKVIEGVSNPDRVSLGDAVVTQRDFPKAISLFQDVLARARAEAKPLIYDIDDLLFELPEGHPYVAVEYFTPALLPMLHAVLEADLVTTATEGLRDYLLPLNSNIRVLRNYLNEEIWKEPPIGRHRNRPPIVVGFMGSDSHLPDLAQLVPVFHRLLEKFGNDIKLKFWGGSPPSEIRTLPQVEWVPLAETNYAQFAGYFCEQESDIFIAPLADSLFNRCKSPIKFLEYSWLGIPGVYSAMAPYQGVVEHGKNGFLASTLAEWEKSIARLVDDESLRRNMGRKARQTVETGWLLSRHAHEWREAYEGGFDRPAGDGLRQTADEKDRLVLRVIKEAEKWQEQLQERVKDLGGKLERERKRTQALSEKLDDILASDAWKMTNRLWSLRSALAPRGSRRERCGQAIMGLMRKGSGKP
jgi:glycosyltransferase involved in cell wall biosynthesis